jgi:hypothetical protein
MRDNKSSEDLPQVGETVLYRHWRSGPEHGDGSRLLTCHAVVVAIYPEFLELRLHPVPEWSGVVDTNPILVPHRSSQDQDGWSRIAD